MNNLIDFATEKKKLLDIYDQIPELGLLPIEEVTEKEFKESRQNLVDEQFILAVCGQMKSGKSTLLNAIFFGKQVLPVDDTVMTAKNTFLKFNEKPKFQVTFYNKNEWKIYINNLKKYEESYMSFNKDIEIAQNNGIYHSEVIRDENKIQRLNGFDQLHKYVSVTEKGGIYTPFVKDITVFYNHEILKDLIVVDTPGINDPNVIRENITKEWIHKAHAVVFVSYAGQAMAQADVDFLDKFILHVPKAHRIIAINKIDTIEDEDEVMDWIRELRNEDIRMRQMFGDQDSLLSTSSLGFLLEQMGTNGHELDEEMEEYYEMMEEKDYLTEDRHHGNKLISLIEKRLIDNKGRNILHSHSKFLESIFDRNILKIEFEIEDKKEDLELMTKDVGELDEMKKQIEKQIGEINQQEKDIEGKMKKKINKIGVTLRTEINKIKRKIIANSIIEIKEINSLHDFAPKVCWIVKNEIENQHDSIFSVISNHQKECSELIKAKRNEIKVYLEEKGTLSTGLITSIIDIPTYKILSKIDSITGSELSQKAINKILNIGYFTWDSEKNRKNARNQIENKLNEIFNEHLSVKMADGIKTTFDQESDKLIIKITHKLLDVLEKKNQNIEKISRDITKFKEKEDIIKDTIISLKSKCEDLLNLKRQYNLGA